MILDKMKKKTLKEFIFFFLTLKDNFFFTMASVEVGEKTRSLLLTDVNRVLCPFFLHRGLKKIKNKIKIKAKAKKSSEI